MKNSEQSSHHHSKLTLVFGIIAILLFIGGGVLGFEYIQLRKENADLQTQLYQLQEALKNSNDSLAQAKNEKQALDNALAAAGAQNQSFATQLDKVNAEVENYQRISQVDPQLLQKYSKVYFLNENYTPSALTNIDTKYLFNQSKPLQFLDRAWPFLRNLLDAAQSAGITLQVDSAYRSFGTQAALKSTYKVTYGAGTANSFSADQGYSEHQLGTAVDFTTPKIGGSLSGFEKSDAYTWLQDNAYKYGFILSYPAHNQYYIFEPWHWRFVGLDLAYTLHNENKNFYDLDQREINQYLATFFNSTTTLPQVQ